MSPSSLEAGAEIEVLWRVENSEGESEPVWFQARIECVKGEGGTTTCDAGVSAVIVYRGHDGHDEVVCDVRILEDGTLYEGTDTEAMRWRFKGDKARGAEDDDLSTGSFEDDESQPAADVIRMALTQAMRDRSDTEQRLLASKVSDALEAFMGGIREGFASMPPDGEFGDKEAQQLLQKLGSKMRDRDVDAMSDGGGSECSFGSR